MSRAAQELLRVQERDLQLLHGLLDSRVMTLAHLAKLYFSGSKEAAKKRVQKLKRAGWISERTRRPYEPAALHLTSKGFDVLREHDTVDDEPSPHVSLVKRMRVSERTLLHELAVMDVKAAICAATMAAQAVKLVQFSTWPARNEFRAIQSAFAGSQSRRVTVKPDGFFHIRETTSDGSFDYRFFIEVDRSTETLEKIVAKALCYRDYYRRGGFAVKHRAPADSFEEFPFVALFVVKSIERRNNITERLLALAPPILSQVWVTTMAELLRNPLGRVWLQPIAYRNGLQSDTEPVLQCLLD
jgi:hypothetical protein